jgi:alpha-ribazole phosphatase
MRNYRLYLIRHGSTRGNDEGLYIGRTDLPLSDAGRADLEDKVKAFVYPKVSRVYSSPLSRAVQTAEILFPDLPSDELLIADDLAEMDFGVFEGLPAVELAELDSYKNWLHGGLDAAPPNGETGRAVLARCVGVIDAIISDMMKSEIYDAGVVTHAGIIANIVSSFGLPKIPPSQITTGFGEGIMLNISAQLWQGAHTFEIVGAIPGDM